MFGAFPGLVGGGAAYTDPDVVAHFSRIWTGGNPAVLDALAALILGLKTDGVWTSLSQICVVHEDASSSLKNLRGAYNDLIYRGNPGFVSLQGFMEWGDAGYDYLGTGILGGSFGQYSHHMWCYSRTDIGTAFDTFMGCNPALAGVPEFTLFCFGGTTVSYTANCAGASVAAKPIGFMGGTRRSNTDIEVIGNNGATAINHTLACTWANPNMELFAGAMNADTNYQWTPRGGRRQMAGWGLGPSLTSAQLANLRTRIITYMTAIGAAVT